MTTLNDHELIINEDKEMVCACYHDIRVYVERVQSVRGNWAVSISCSQSGTVFVDKRVSDN